MQAEWAAQTPELIKRVRPIPFKVLELARGAKDEEYVLYPFTLHLEGVAHVIELVRASRIVMRVCVFVKRTGGAYSFYVLTLSHTNTLQHKPLPSSSTALERGQGAPRPAHRRARAHLLLPPRDHRPLPLQGPARLPAMVRRERAQGGARGVVRPEMLRWRYVQIEELLQAVVANRKVGLMAVWGVCAGCNGSDWAWAVPRATNHIIQHHHHHSRDIHSQLWELPAVRITLDLDSLDRAIANKKQARAAAAAERGMVVAAY